jgi:hypothetical protein
MNIAIQSRPVSRAPVVRFAAKNGVEASGDGCSTGHWCCSPFPDGSHPVCVKCPTTWWAPFCIVEQTQWCNQAGAYPSDQCGG